MQIDTIVLLLALFGAFILGFLAGLLVNWLRRLAVGVWHAPGRVARRVSHFGSRIRARLRPAPTEGPEGRQEIALPSQPVSRAVALLLTFPVRRAQELYAMGELALAEGHDRIAEGHYLTALFWDRGRALLPLHIRINLRLGEIRARRTDYEGAIVAYERVRALDPGNAEAYLQLGLLYFRIGQIGQALYELGRALEIDPDNLDVRYYLFQIYQQSGMQQEATRQLRLLKAGEEPGIIAGLFLQHGEEHFRGGELELAAIDYRLVLELTPDREEAIWALGDILRRQGQPLEALRVWAHGLWTVPSAALDERLLLLAREGLGEEVALAYQRAILLRPRTGQFHLVLGDLAEQSGQVEEALRHWQQAAAVQPDLVEAHLRLERHHEQAGQAEQARSHLRAAMRALWGREIVYHCRICGHVTLIEQAYCFACNTWDGFVPRQRAELEVRTDLVPAALAQEARALVRRLGGWWGRFRGLLLGGGEE